MGKKISGFITVLGVIIAFGGLLAYGLVINELLPIPRPDLLIWGTSLCGVLLIVTGSLELLSKKSKLQAIEEGDERNVAIANNAMATAFKVMTFLFVPALFALIFMGYMTEVASLTLIIVYLISQIVFVVRLKHLEKRM